VGLRPFEEIVSEHGEVVLRVCRALVGPEAAQDAWSETFLSALRAYPDLRPDSDVRAWLVTIAHRRTIDQLRRRRRDPAPLADAPEPCSAGAVDDGLVDPADDLWAALARLAPRQRTAVVCRYVADLSYADVASVLGCSQAAARRSAADGIARLRHDLEEAPR
jgi:RNA polymerase sigma factor (sigma-70 family)